MASRTKTVSFRLDESYLERLRALAARYGLSDGEMARRLVLDALEETEKERLREDVQALQESIGGLRTDLIVAVRALLVGAGRVEKDRAEVWVQQNLGEGAERTTGIGGIYRGNL